MDSFLGQGSVTLGCCDSDRMRQKSKMGHTASQAGTRIDNVVDSV